MWEAFDWFFCFFMESDNGTLFFHIFNLRILENLVFFLTIALIYECP